LAVSRQGDLRAWIAAFLDVLLDQPVEMIERLGGETETGGLGGWQRIVAWHWWFSSLLAWQRRYACHRLRPTAGCGSIRKRR
jgi:hypothetical protein